MTDAYRRLAVPTTKPKPIRSLEALREAAAYVRDHEATAIGDEAKYVLRMKGEIGAVLNLVDGYWNLAARWAEERGQFRVIELQEDFPVDAYLMEVVGTDRVELTEEVHHSLTEVTPWNMLFEIRTCLQMAEVPETFVDNYLCRCRAESVVPTSETILEAWATKNSN